ncbi:MAG: PC4/YdbC family ssDNA-binding protein [archaeon]|nr:PC4/YdbC family ssDNA-binding protein [archaeon]
MDKDVIRFPKSGDTEIVVRVDDFGGKRGVTIREFVKSERYTGFTKAGTRIPADRFNEFKDAINSIDENELALPAETKPMPRAEGNGGRSFGNKGGFGNKSFDSSNTMAKKKASFGEDIDEVAM